MVDTQTLNELKNKLEEERVALEAELADIGKPDNQNPDDWHGDAGNVETGTADAQLLADKFEESLTNEGITSTLEERLAHVQDALVRIANGTYGVCSEGGEEISVERLKVNPAAATCIKHAS